MPPAAAAPLGKGVKKAGAASKPGQPSERAQPSDRKSGTGGKKSGGAKGKERKMHFTVPDGVQPGETLKLMTPRGGEVEVEVPMDAKVGKSFAVTIPASSSNTSDAPKKEATRISVTVPQGGSTWDHNSILTSRRGSKTCNRQWQLLDSRSVLSRGI